MICSAVKANVPMMTQNNRCKNYIEGVCQKLRETKTPGVDEYRPKLKKSRVSGVEQLV